MMDEKKVYILLTDTGTFLTRMIKLYTKKPYNHASISFDSEFEEVFSFGRKTPRNPFVGGFVKENLKNELFKNARCEIYSFSVDDIQVRKMLDLIQKIERKKHLYRYNFIGLFALALRKQLEREYAFFCSEFVATVLQEGAVVDFQKPLSFVSPQDLQSVEKFQLEYRGNLADLYIKKRKEPILRTLSVGR